MPNNSNVDQRIIEMRIDNDKFEAGAKKTLDILDKLDKSLNGIGKVNTEGFDNVSKTMDVINNKFSIMGTVGDQVIRNLTNKVMELTSQFHNMATAFTTQQIGVGFEKFGDKTKAVQTIMASTHKDIGEIYADEAEQLDDVNSKIEKLTWYTDETSYAMMDMVSNIGKFTANGQDLEKSVTAMEGIANWASISGGHISEASRAMYNLSQALGLGAVTVIDWKSIENANMATQEFKQTAIATAEEMGRLQRVSEDTWVTTEKTMKAGEEVSVKTFREALRYKWFDSEVLIGTLNKYGAFTDELKVSLDELKESGIDLIATDMIKAMKAFDENGTDGLKLLRYTDDQIQIMLPHLQKLTSEEFELGRRAFEAAQQARTYREAVDATKEAVSTKWMQIFEYLFGNYLEAKELWTNLSEVLWDMFAGPVDLLRQIAEFGFKTFRGGVDETGKGLKVLSSSTASFEEKLSKVGKTMADFRKAVYSVADRSLLDNIENFASATSDGFEEALKAGVISEETFKRAIVAMDDSESKTMSLQKALVKNNKTLDDFKKALFSVTNRRDILEGVINNFGGLEAAIRNGALTTEEFKKALESLGIESENVTQTAEENAKHAIGTLEDMRKVALEVLRGDWKNGDERKALLEAAGYNYELIQAMAGDLQWFYDNYGSYEASDEMLMQWMEKYYQYQGLAAELGYETFEEWIATSAAANEALYTTDNMLNEAGEILQSIYGNDIFDTNGDLKSGGEMFREGLTNIMTFFDDISEAISNAFLRAFVGSEKAEDAVRELGGKFWNLAKRFLDFTEKIQLRWEEMDGDKLVEVTDRFDALVNFMTVIIKLGRAVGKVIGTIFKVFGKIAGLAFRIVGVVTNAIVKSGFLSIIEVALDAFIAVGDAIGNIIDLISGGLTNGLDSMNKSVNSFIGDHPVLLSVFNGLTKVATVLWQALQHVGDVLLFIGGLIGGVFFGLFATLSAVFGAIVEGVTWVYNWARSNETLNAILTSVSNKLKDIGKRLQIVRRYMMIGYERNGFKGAFESLIQSFQVFFPWSKKITSVFGAIGDVFKGLQLDLSKLGPKFEKLGNDITAAWNNLFKKPVEGKEKTSLQDGIRQFLNSIWTIILDFIRDVRISDVIKALRLGLIASLISEVIGAITVFKNIERSVADIPKLLTNLLGGIVETVKSFAANIRADTIIKLAVALGIMASAFYVMSKIPEDQLTHVAVISGIMLYLLTQLAKLLQTSKLFGNGLMDIKIFQVIPSVMGILVGVGFALVSFAASMAILATLDTDKVSFAFWKIVALFITIVAGMIAIALTLTKFNGYKMNVVGPTISKLASAMLSIGFAVQLLIAPIVAFTLVQNFGVGKFERAVIAVIGIIAIMALAVNRITKQVQYMTPDQLIALGAVMRRIAGAMKGFAFAVMLLTASIAGLTFIQNFGVGKFRRAVVVVAGLITLMSVLVGLFVSQLAGIAQNESKFDGRGYDLQNIGNMILKASLAMVIIGVAVGILAKSITKLALLGNNGQTKLMDAVWIVGSLIAGMSILVGIFVSRLAEIQNFQKINEIGNTLLKAAVAMVVVAYAVQMLIKPISSIAGKKGILGAAVLVGALTAGLILAFAQIAKMLDKMGGYGPNGADRIAAIGKALVGLGAAFALFALGMMFLTPVISVFAGVMARLAKSIVTMENFQAGFLKLVGIAASMVVFSFALSWLAVALIGVAGAFSIFAIGLLIFVGAAILFAKNADMIKEALPKLVEGLAEAGKSLRANWKDVLLITGIIVGLTVAFGLLLKLLNSKHNIIARLGSFFTSIFTTITGALTKGLVSTRDGVFNFFKKFPAWLAANRKGLLDILTYTIGVIGLYISGLIPTLVDVIADAVITTLDSLGDVLTERKEELGAAITKVVKGIITVAAEVVRSIFSKEMWKSLDGLEKALAVGIGVTAVLSAFNKITKAIDGAKGITGALGKAKTGIVALCDTIGISVGGAIGIVLALAAAFAYAWHESNKQQDILRENVGNPQTVSEYEQSISQLNNEIAQLKAAADNGATEWSLFQEMDAKTLLVKQLTSELAELRKQEELASSDSNSIGFEYSSSGNASGKVRETKQLATETKAEIEDASYTFDGLQTKISSFLGENGIDITDFITTDGLNTEALMTKINSSGLSDEFYKMFDGFGGFADAGLGDGFLNNSEVVKTSISSLLSSLFTHTQEDPNMDSHSPSKAYAKIGDSVPAGIAMGIDRSQSVAVSAMTNFLTRLLSISKITEGSFYNSGVAVVQGVINGIRNNYNAAAIAGANLATVINNSFRNRLRIKSPSRVFMESGKYIVEGVTQGIEDGQGGAITSIVGFSEELLKAMDLAMARVATVANDEFEWSPRITPVVDLSNVSNASRSINGAFGGIGTVGAAQAERYSSYIPTGSRSSGVVNEIQALSSRMDALGEAVTNMQIVLDTGVLVGATSSKMDAKLGVLAARKGRGN